MQERDPSPSDGRPPLVSVVIPVKDDPERLDGCLRALAGQSLDAPYEVLVVDNGSAVPPRDVVARDGRARLLEERRPSSYAARNRGVEAAAGEIVAFTDSDCVPDADWLRHGVAAVRAQPRECFVGGHIDTVASAGGPPSAVEVYEMAHAFPQRLYVESGYAATANLFVRREVFRRVGAFDATLASGGDMEWGLRAKAAGVAPVYAADARVAHPARRTFGELRRKLARVAQGHAELRGRRGERLTAGQMARRLYRPPVVSSLRRARTLTTPARSRAGYVAVAIAVHYTRSFDQIRHELRQRAGRPS